MKNAFSYVFKSFPKALLASVLIAMAILIPVSSITAAGVKLEGAMGVANVTAGDTKYSPSVNASYDQVVKVEVYYHNTENADSGKVAENLKVKITMPTGAGKTQVVKSTISADNAANTVANSATVNLDRSDATLDYIPGSAVWKHNTGTNDNVNMVETRISDAIVTSGQGLVLENEKPCYNFAATVTVLARVHIPGVKVVKEVRVKGETAWTKSNSAPVGSKLEYRISYQNVGNTNQDNVVIRDALPAGVKLVAGTTTLETTQGKKNYNSDNIDNGGIVIGSYAPGGGARVVFEATTPAESALACGANTFHNIGVARPQGFGETYDTTDTVITRVCNPSAPQYSCDALTVKSIGTRQIEATVAYTAKNGATFKSVSFDFGDTTAPLVTDKTTTNHTYAADGTYTVRATPSFMVDGKLVTSNSAACAKVVTFSKGEVVTPPTPGTTPSTGPTETIGLFIGASVLSAIGYRLWMIRRLGN